MAVTCKYLDEALLLSFVTACSNTITRAQQPACDATPLLDASQFMKFMAVCWNTVEQSRMDRRVIAEQNLEIDRLRNGQNETTVSQQDFNIAKQLAAEREQAAQHTLEVRRSLARINLFMNTS